MNLLKLNTKQSIFGNVANLPSSKSISNRAIILKALANGNSELANLSNANDTQLMLHLVNSDSAIIDVEDAGTVMRFLTAFFTVTNKHKVVTGTARMKERPIGILVDALRLLGGDIQYLEREGYPPISIKAFKPNTHNKLNIQGDISSQFISALMMVAPILPQGLVLTLTGKIGSRPYIEMTASLMRKFGAEVQFENNTITIAAQQLKSIPYTVEGDWSSASYWFAFTALSKEAELSLPNMTLRSLQGDRVIVDIMENLGVACEPRGNHILLKKKGHQPSITVDFTDCPDLAQTIAVVCAAKGINGTFTGLESLRIKETDRIKALQIELAKINASLIEKDNVWILVPSKQLPKNVTINTYHDHRMAMAFAPLACMMEVEIEDPYVTRKSYPKFWDDMKNLGFKLSS